MIWERAAQMNIINTAHKPNKCSWFPALFSFWFLLSLYGCAFFMVMSLIVLAIKIGIVMTVVSHESWGVWPTAEARATKARDAAGDQEGILKRTSR